MKCSLSLVIFILILTFIALLFCLSITHEAFGNIITNADLPTQSNPTILNPSPDPVPTSNCIGRYCWKTTASAYNQTATIPESIGKYGYLHNYDVLPDSKATLDKHDASSNRVDSSLGPFSGNFLLGSEAKPY